MTKKPESFNANTLKSIDTLLNNNAPSHDWIAALLFDCQLRVSLPEKLKDTRLLKPSIFYGLAGFDPDFADYFRRVIACPEEFDTAPLPDSMVKLQGIFGSEGLAQIGTYHVIRDNLRWFQQLHNIPAIEPRSLAIRDKLFSYFDYDYQMALLPNDRVVLKNQVAAITKYFGTVSQGYELLEKLEDENTVPLDTAKFSSAIAEADYAWIYSRSYTWESVGEGQYQSRDCPRLEPDQITLSLQKWDGDAYDGFFYVKAMHPDKSRFPWLNS